MRVSFLLYAGSINLPVERDVISFELATCCRTFFLYS